MRNNWLAHFSHSAGLSFSLGAACVVRFVIIIFGALRKATRCGKKYLPSILPQSLIDFDLGIEVWVW